MQLQLFVVRILCCCSCCFGVGPVSVSTQTCIFDSSSVTYVTTLHPCLSFKYHNFSLLLAAVLAGKKRGRPRSNPLPILTAAHLMSNSNNNSNGSDGGSMISGDGTGRWFVLQMFVVAMIIVLKRLFLCVFVIGVALW